jgi:macrolide phosphotransferase
MTPPDAVRDLLADDTARSRAAAAGIVSSMRGGDIADREVAIIDDGWDFRVFRAAGYVVRVARRASAIDGMEREIAVLNELRGEVRIQLPRPVRYAARVTVGPWISGRPLTESDISAVSDELADVLATVHAQNLTQWFPPEQMNPGFHRRRAAATLCQARTAGVTGPEMDVLRAGLEDDDLWRFATVPTHGDLLPPHILVADGVPRIAGILDWTDARYDDPAIDLSGVCRSVSDAACGQLRASYLSRTDPGARFADRIRIRQAWADVVEASASLGAHL